MSMNCGIEAWLYHSPNRDAKLRSSSGGAFYELAKNALAEGYFLCGCVWDNNLVARHIVSRDINDLQRMQGSKYVQSCTGEAQRELIKLLKQGNKILFSGTPCQVIAASKIASILNKRDNLLSVAVICHGVPSPLSWESYKIWLNSREHDFLTDVNFRDKSVSGYRKQNVCYTFKSGKRVIEPSYLPTSKYMEASIVYNLSTRECCTKCKAKGWHDGIDIILGDWYAEYRGKGILGNSCICAYTDKGKVYVRGNLSNLQDIDYGEILRENSLIEKSTFASKNRQRFFTDLMQEGFWDKVERLYPPKYPMKVLLVRLGLYDWLKRVKEILK